MESIRRIDAHPGCSTLRRPHAMHNCTRRVSAKKKKKKTNTCWHQRHALHVCYMFAFFFILQYKYCTQCKSIVKCFMEYWSWLVVCTSCHTNAFSKFTFWLFRRKKRLKTILVIVFHFVYIGIYILGTALITRTFQSRKKSIRWILNGLFIVFSYFFFHPFWCCVYLVCSTECTLGAHMRIGFLFCCRHRVKVENSQIASVNGLTVDRHIVRSESR